MSKISNVSFAALFKASVIASAFDAECLKQAATGRVYQPLVTALNDEYKIDMPATTVGALRLIVGKFLTETKPEVIKGKGAAASLVTLTQALHAYGEALLAGMNAEKRPYKTLPALPKWADPVAIQQAKDAKKAAKAAEKEDAGEGEDTGEGEGSSAGETVMPLRDFAAEAAEAWAKFAPYLSMGVITAAERDAFIEALTVSKVAPSSDVVVTTAEAEAKTVKAPKRTKRKVMDAIPAQTDGKVMPGHVSDVTTAPALVQADLIAA